MTIDASTSYIQQAIFRRGLPTETVSLYLLCCGLLDAGQKATRRVISQCWNAGEDQLAQSLETLLAEGILSVDAGPEDSAQQFTVMDPKYWRPLA
ncbi:MAG: hypothetical protein ABIL58_27715 [Pseudomonadota bacterium]